MIPQHQLLRIRPQIHPPGVPHPVPLALAPLGARGRRHGVAAEVVVKEGERHDQGNQFLAIVFNEGQQLLLVVAR